MVDVVGMPSSCALSMTVDPVGRADARGRDALAQLVVEDLGARCRAASRAPLLSESRQELAAPALRQLRAVQHLLGRERVDVHVRRRARTASVSCT
jgi:hypothetical protein